MIGADDDPADAMSSPAKSCIYWQSARGQHFEADLHPEVRLSDTKVGNDPRSGTLQSTRVG